MLNTFTQAEPGQIEADIVEIAKGALPPTREEWKRYDELRGRDEYVRDMRQLENKFGRKSARVDQYKLTEVQRAELSALNARAERLLLWPEEIEAEEILFTKYGPTTGTAVPRRAITTQQSIVEKALAAAFYGHGRGPEQPFSERGGATISLDEYEQPKGRDKGRGVGDEFEKAQELGGKQITGPGDGFKMGREPADGRLPLLPVFPTYIGMAPWIIWDAIREFDPAKRKPNNPDPLGAVIWNVATRRVRHELDRLPHGTRRAKDLRHDHSHEQRMLDLMEDEFFGAMAKADAAVELFLKETSNAVDAAVLKMWWPLPDWLGSRPQATLAAGIADKLRCHRSVIGRRIERIRKQIKDLDYVLVIWEALDSYGRGKTSWSELATNPKLGGIINRSVIVPPLVRTERRSTGILYPAPYDPYHQTKRRVRHKNGQYRTLTCQRTAARFCLTRP